MASAPVYRGEVKLQARLVDLYNCTEDDIGACGHSDWIIC